MQKYILILSIFLLGLSACEDAFETTLKVDPPPHTPQLTVHSFLMDDDEFIGISVGRSFGLLDTEPNYEEQFLSDATIEIHQQGTLKYTVPSLPDALPINYGVELPGTIGGLGDSFEIKVIHPDYGTATAVQYMPEPVQVTSAIYEEDGGIGGENGERSNIVDITFTDPAGVKNYYEIYIAYFNPANDSYNDTYTMSGDPNLQEGLNDGHLLSDQTFDGNAYTLRLDLDNGYADNMVVVFRSVTESWYLYSRSMNDFRGNEDFGLFSEPVTVHNNVTGGLGIFAAGTEVIFPVVE